MTRAFDEIPDAIATQDGPAPSIGAHADTFLWRQLQAAGLADIAEEVAAGREIDLASAITLSQASLPLLGKIVELRLVADGATHAIHSCAHPAALPFVRAASEADLTQGVGQPLADWESFCSSLLAIRDELASGSELKTWYPILAGTPDQEGAGEHHSSGVDVLRAIALARLVLPADIEVRAPLATLGPKLAQVALDFGASHLGCVAVQGQPSNDPLVADSAIFDELLESCQQTEIRTNPS